MKKIIVLLALSWGGFCMAQQPDSGTGTGSKADLFEKKHRVGIRKSIIPIYQNSTYKNVWQRHDYQVQYTYRFGKRWQVGFSYSYLNYQFQLADSRSINGVSSPNVLKTSDVQISSSNNFYRVLAAYDFIQKPFLIARINVYLPIYRHSSFQRTILAQWDEAAGELSNSKTGRVQGLGLSKEDGIGMLPEFVLDLLYPFKQGEIGLSPYFDLAGSVARAGLYATFNFKF